MMKKPTSSLAKATLLFLLVGVSSPSNSQTVTYPTNAGITWYIGSTYAITWNGFPMIGAVVTIDLYKGGVYYERVSNALNAVDGVYMYEVPYNIQPGSDYQIKITGPPISPDIDYSDNYFTVAVNPVVTNPTEPGLFWYRGLNYDITWKGFWGTYVKIELYKGSSLAYTIADSKINDGLQGWTVPLSLPGDSDYYIKISSNDHPEITDNSDYTFTIVAQPMVLYPSYQGIILLTESNYEITWKNFLGLNVKIDLLRFFYPYFFLDHTIIQSTENDGSFSWQVPTSITPDNNIMIRITDLDYQSSSGLSRNFFSIAKGVVSVRKNEMQNDQELICYPNPFSNEINIKVTSDENSVIAIYVIAMDGRIVRQLINEVNCPIGIEIFRWDGKNDQGNYVPPGLYYLKMKINDNVLYRKMLFSK
jgi:hypothetical protein